MNKCQSETMQDCGTYSCCNCGTNVSLNSTELLPECPKCGNDTFVKISDVCRD